jgi:hypothetical protein
MRAEILHGLFWLCIGIITTFSSTHYSLGSFSDPGPGALPFILGLVFILLALITLVKSVRVRAPRDPTSAFTIGTGWRTVAAVIVTLVVSAIVFESLGFLITVFLLVTVSMLLMEPRRWMLAVFMGLASSLGSYVIFDIWLKVQLPRGILHL